MAQLHGQGPIGAPGGTSVQFTTPYPLTPGARMRDASGNEYVFCDFTGQVYTNQPVSIADDNTASAIGAGGRGRVGVAMKGGTSDNAGWVQVYGRAEMLVGTPGTVSVSGVSLTTLSTSAAIIFAMTTDLTSPAAARWVSAPSLAQGNYIIKGITVATDASVSLVSEDDTSATSTSITVAQVGVFLNYPRFEYYHVS